MRYWLGILALCLVVAHGSDARADESGTSADEMVAKVVKAAGGQDRLLDVFRFRERLLITRTPAPPVTADEKGNRTSVVKVGGGWWLGTKKRNKDKVRVLLWAWSLRILLAENSKVERIPDIVVGEDPAFGLRVTGAVEQPVDLYFDKDSHRLRAIDYTNSRHIFSDWKETSEGHLYPAHAAGFRFADQKAGKLKPNQWYQTDILELTPLKELPADLK